MSKTHSNHAATLQHSSPRPNTHLWIHTTSKPTTIVVNQSMTNLSNAKNKFDTHSKLSTVTLIHNHTATRGPTLSHELTLHPNEQTLCSNTLRQSSNNNHEQLHCCPWYGNKKQCYTTAVNMTNHLFISGLQHKLWNWLYGGLNNHIGLGNLHCQLKGIQLL